MALKNFDTVIYAFAWVGLMTLSIYFSEDAFALEKPNMPKKIEQKINQQKLIKQMKLRICSSDTHTFS